MMSQSGHGFLSIFFGGKYDMIQLHIQIIHQNAQELLFHQKIIITTSNFYLRENNENDMTLVVWAVVVFGPRVWSLSARHHLLAG